MLLRKEPLYISVVVQYQHMTSDGAPDLLTSENALLQVSAH